MKEVLFFGSFNPIHIGHLIMANSLVENYGIDRVCFVVSPHNPFKEETSLLKKEERIKMVQIAIEPYAKFSASDIEFRMPNPSYTIDTLEILKSKNPQIEYVILMGEDNLLGFNKWKRSQDIINNYKIYVIPRIVERSNESKKEEELHPNFIKIESPLFNISSTMVRGMIKENKNFRPFVAKEVFDYINKKKFYK